MLINMSNRINVFLDTNIYMQYKFNIFNNNKFESLKYFVSNEKISLYTTDIVIKECESKIIDQANKINAQLKELKKSLNWDLIEETELKKNMEVGHIENESVLIKKSLDKFHNGLEDLKVEVLDLEKVDIKTVFNKYFESELPFENKKKSEFPDAFTIESIKEEMKMYPEMKMNIVSIDKGFLGAFSQIENCSTFETLEKLLDFINSEIEKEYEALSIRLNEMENEFQEVITEEIYNSNFNNITVTYENIEYSDIYINNVKVIEISDIMINKIRENIISVSVECFIELDTSNTYEDYENSIWDSEEKEYLYLKEDHYIEEHSFITTVNVELERREDINEFDIKKVQVDIDLNNDTLYNRIEENHREKYEEVLADSMDALEEYHNH